LNRSKLFSYEKKQSFLENYKGAAEHLLLSTFFFKQNGKK